ncbi:copia protein [Tanacetum coccineum]
MLKEGKSSSSSKGTSRSHHKSSGKSAHVEEPSHTVDDSGVQKNQEFDTEKSPTSFDELMDTLIDFSAFVLNRLNIINLTQELLVGLAFNLLKGTFIPQDYFNNNDLEYLKGGSLSREYSTSVTKTKAATYEIKWIEDMVPNLWSLVKVVYDKHAYWVTRLKIMKRYDYGHSDEIKVHREDQQLYTFKEGGFPRLRLQDIEDMLLLLVQQKLTNIMIDERYDLNVALCMFTRRIFIQRRVEDLQLGDGMLAKEEIEWTRQVKNSGCNPGYRQAALSKKVNEEFGEVRFYTSAGNHVKEIVLKLNLPDHRILKDGGKALKWYLEMTLHAPLKDIVLSNVMFDEKKGIIFNSNKEVVRIAPRVRDVYVLDMTSSAQQSCFFTKASESTQSTLRNDNGTEFRNRILVDFYDEKGISENLSSPYTPEQNGVVKRKNKTLKEAARTMLSGSVFLKQYWTKAVATACYT